MTHEGDLLIVEVRHGRDAAGIYSSPVQVWGYLEQWRKPCTAQPNLRAAINQMIEQRQRLTFLPEHALKLREGFELMPLVMFGGSEPSKEVRKRFKWVCDIMDHFHPGSAGGWPFKDITFILKCFAHPLRKCPCS